MTIFEVSLSMPRALALLKDIFGYPAFRGRQAEVIAHVA
jgi:ATP-dependent DNA helicase RecQ